VYVNPIRWAARAAGATLVVGFLACAGEGTTGPDDGNGGGAPTLSGDVQPIFTANCAFSGCHGGSSPAQGMNLSAGQAFQNTVNVASVELPSMDRIEPGQPGLSYLLNKIQGTQGTVGGSGQRMPLGGSPLSQDDINTVRAWVQAGAPNN
jgi:hypothetical protein